MSTNEPESITYRVPCNNTLQHACKLSMVDDKPIMLDYWANSCDKQVLIGIRESGEKLLVKSEDEYTSPVSKIYKVGEGEDENGKSIEDYIIITENSIYLVNADIETKRIS
jgi:hypothetical protein|tara:strand:+ start:3202 stop:3534 length:333 start_codon:yes stop_codon:yes gene_type:complete